MAKHVWVNPERLRNAQKTEQFEGIELRVELSPYDTPQEIIGEYKDGHFEISFQYIDNEPCEVVEEKAGVRVYAGRYSGKLMRLRIPIDKPPLDKSAIIELETTALEAIELIKPSKHKRGRMNRKVAAELLKDEFENLTDDLVAT